MAKIDLYQLDDFTDDFAPNKVDGSVPVWDEANQQLKPLPYPTTFFTPVHYRNTLTTTRSSSSTSFGTLHSYTSPSVPASTYRIVWGIVFNTASSASLLVLEVTENAVNLVNTDHQESTGASSSRSMMSYSAIVTVASARTMPLLMRYRRQSGSGTINVYNSFFDIERII